MAFLFSFRTNNRSYHDGTIGGYNKLFSEGISQIKRHCKPQILALNKLQQEKEHSQENQKCPHILLDGTPRYFHNFKGVENDPFNAGLAEPKVFVPHRINHWLPNAKLILMLRNPIERMLSAYRYF